MIKSFTNKQLKALWETGRSKIDARMHPRILRRLDALDAATAPEDMNLPGYKFHQLTGNRKGTYAVTVTGNWRITFRFDGEDAVDVDLEDYH